jgi:hypothetical protein
MPSKSQKQMKYIYAMRDKYVNKKRAPKNMKWVFDEEWTKGIKMKELPKKVKNESRIMNFKTFVNESYTFEDFSTADMEYIKDLWNDGASEMWNDNEDDAINFLSRESDIHPETVEQIVRTMLKSGEIELA